VTAFPPRGFSEFKFLDTAPPGVLLAPMGYETMRLMRLMSNQGHQPLWGGIYSRERLAGGNIPLPPRRILPDGPPILGLDYAHSEGARSHFLPIFTDNLGELLDCHFIGSIILQVHVVDSSSGFC